MKFSPLFITLLLSLLLSAPAVQAETRYIADQLVVTVRSSTGKNYTVLENLQTDTPIEVLEDDGSFVKVKTEKGNTGYIRSQYVSRNTPKPIRIAELEQQVTSLQTQLEKERQACLDNKVVASDSQGEIDSLSKELQQVQAELEKVTTDYENLRERSKDVLEMMTAYEEQTEENYQLSSELEILREENKGFHRSNMIQWFLAGGGVFFFGWLAGKISRRKRGFSRF